VRDDAERVQKTDAAARESLRGGRTNGSGSSTTRSAPAATADNARRVLKNGEIAPLNKISAQRAHDGTVFPDELPWL
jgi:hypothetical protein